MAQGITSSVKNVGTGGGGGSVDSVTASEPLASSGGANPDISIPGLSGYGSVGDSIRVNATQDGLEYYAPSAGGVTDVTATSPLASSGGATPDISLSGVVPVANGGTNSSAALNNNRVMVSSGSAVVEASAITASRILVSDANGIPVASSQASSELGTYVVGPGSATDNAVVRFDGTTGKLVQNSAVTIADTTGAISVTGSPVNNALSIAGGSLSVASDAFIRLTGTLNTAGLNLGILSDMTTAGVGASTYIGIRSRFQAGFTGAGFTASFQALNAAAGAGADLWNSAGNVGLTFFVNGSTSTGHNAGMIGLAENGKFNFGVLAGVDTTPNGGAGQNAGGFFTCHPGNGTTDEAAAVYGILSTGAVSTMPAGIIGAGVFNNGSTSHAVILGLDNGTACFTVADGGAATLGAASTTPTHRLNTATTAAGTDAMTLLNGPAGTAGDPDVFITININGTAHVIPAWTPT